MSMTDPNGTFVMLSEINEMISDGILTVDFDKLEQRIYDKTVIKCGLLLHENRQNIHQLQE